MLRLCSSDRALTQQLKYRLDSRHQEGPLGTPVTARLNMNVQYKGTEAQMTRRAILESSRSHSFVGEHCHKAPWTVGSDVAMGRTNSCTPIMWFMVLLCA